MPLINAYFAALFSLPFLAFSGWFGARSLGVPFSPASTTVPVACTAEARLCPGGSYVGRTGPHCEFAACPGSTSTPVAAPVRIGKLAPERGAVGTQVTLTGSGFTDDNTVRFGSGAIVHVASSGRSRQSLTFTVPSSLTPVCYFSTPRCLVASRQTLPGSYDVSVSNGSGTSNVVRFTVTPQN